MMDLHPFAGFQVTQKAGSDLRHLVTESKWRKLQKHFSISICFSCCYCELLLSDLEILYDHFSTVHQVDLSFIESLLKESEEGTAVTETEHFELSENLIDDLIQLGISPASIQNICGEEPKTDKDDGVQIVNSKSDVPKRKGRPKKRSLHDKSKNVLHQKVKDKVEVSIAERTRKGRKTSQVTTVAEANGSDTKTTKKSSRKTHGTRSASKVVAKPIEDTYKEPENITDEGTCDDENITEDISAFMDEVVNVISTPEETGEALKRTVGRNVDSEEIKAKTCAICKEIQPSIKDCFQHYELVHDYIPKSVYEKPPVDTKFEQNKSKKDKKSKGRSKTDGNAEQCRFCGKMFLKANIDKHIHLRHYWLRIERKEKRRQNVVCHLCGKLYHHKQNLEAHMASAHRGKPRRKPTKSSTVPTVHICQTCGYTTPEIRRLKNHIAAHHEGVMPYRCDQCSFQTWEPSSWRCHKQRHSEDKKYKCTECSYQCIQRKQLRRHMGVKHQTLLPKKWKRKDDTSPTSHSVSKLLQNTSDVITKQMSYQNARHVPSSMCTVESGSSGMQPEDESGETPTLIEHLQYEVSNSMQSNVQFVQLAPTVEVSSLQQTDLTSLSGDIIPTEVVITVGSTSDYSSNKSLTSIANSHAISGNIRVGNMEQVHRTHLSSQLLSRDLIVIPPSTPSYGEVFDESSGSVQQLVLAERHVEEDQPGSVQSNIPKRRYYRPHFPLLKGIIGEAPGGPMLQTNKDGSVIIIPKVQSTTKGESHSKAGFSANKDTSADSSLQHVQHTVINEGQQILYLDSDTEDVDVYSGNDASVSTIDIRQASELADLLPQSVQTRQGKVTKEAAKSSSDTTLVTDESEGMKSLEQDIAQTLIQINPLSRLQNTKPRKK